MLIALKNSQGSDKTAYTRIPISAMSHCIWIYVKTKCTTLDTLCLNLIYFCITTCVHIKQVHIQIIRNAKRDSEESLLTLVNLFPH